MNYDFYANDSDKVEILEFIFSKTNLHIYDLGSEYGKEVCLYRSVEDITSKFDLAQGYPGQTFQLWSPDFKALPFMRKIELDPKRCGGHTFRYATDGWGLIQLYFNGVKGNTLHKSHMGHSTEKRALTWEAEALKIHGSKVADWNWTEVSKHSRKLKSFIHANAISKHSNGLDILKGASLIAQQGIKF